jgi:hypothetical protein
MPSSKLLSLFAAFALSLSSVACAAPDAETENEPVEALDQDVTSRKAFFLSASTVADEVEGSSFTGSGGPLGSLGPIGAWGPLGALGPVGNNTWNPSQWIPAFQPVKGGPLSEAGPLGPNGPISKRSLSSLPDLGGESKQLGPGGYLTVLGPVGPLGALGPLGPLGPVGGHGYSHDRDGNYRDADGNVVRTVQVPYEGTTRTYELVEKYSEQAAKAMNDNDTSFMAIGSITSSRSEVDAYSFTSKDAQLVTITVVPENQLSDFDLEIVDSSGRTVLRSDEQVDFAQIQVKAGEKLTAKITAKSVNVWFPTYRLIVVGSTKYIPTSEIRGAFQVER